jgi:hypothetical protein
MIEEASIANPLTQRSTAIWSRLAETGYSIQIPAELHLKKSADEAISPITAKPHPTITRKTSDARNAPWVLEGVGEVESVGESLARMFDTVATAQPTSKAPATRNAIGKPGVSHKGELASGYWSTFAMPVARKNETPTKAAPQTHARD